MRTSFSEIWIKIQQFLHTKMSVKCLRYGVHLSQPQRYQNVWPDLARYHAYSRVNAGFISPITSNRKVFENVATWKMTSLCIVDRVKSYLFFGSYWIPCRPFTNILHDCFMLGIGMGQSYSNENELTQEIMGTIRYGYNGYKYQITTKYTED